jgi:hypothetical protein
MTKLRRLSFSPEHSGNSSVSLGGVEKVLHSNRLDKACPSRCISVCIQVLAKYEPATHIEYWDIRASIRRHLTCRRVMLLFDFNGNFAKIPAIQKQGGPSAHFLFVRTV